MVAPLQRGGTDGPHRPPAQSAEPDLGESEEPEVGQLRAPPWIHARGAHQAVLEEGPDHEPVVPMRTRSLCDPSSRPLTALSNEVITMTAPHNVDPHGLLVSRANARTPAVNWSNPNRTCPF